MKLLGYSTIMFLKALYNHVPETFFGLNIPVKYCTDLIHKFLKLGTDETYNPGEVNPVPENGL